MPWQTSSWAARTVCSRAAANTASGNTGRAACLSRTTTAPPATSPSTSGCVGIPFTPPSEENGKTPCYAPGVQSQRYPNAPVGYIYAGDPGCPEGGSDNQWAQFAPRFGFAWNVAGKGTTSIRGGIGLSYQPPFLEAYNQMSATPPFSQQVDLRRARYPRMTFADPYGSAGVQNPFPAGYGPKTPDSDAPIVTPVVAVTYARDWRPSQVWTWNLMIERQLVKDLVLRTGYAGSKGTHLGINTDLNAGH